MYTKNIKELKQKDAQYFGGKAASLGEVASVKLRVPKGFAISFDAYKYFVEKNHIDEIIKKCINSYMDGNINVKECSDIIYRGFISGIIPDVLKSEIYSAYHKNKLNMVAVRSSANLEDLPNASFAGQHDTFLSVPNLDVALLRIKECWASIWNVNAIKYRQEKDFNQNNVCLAIIIQEMLKPEISGVTFTFNAISMKKEEIVINAGRGLGEEVVSGRSCPDTYIYNTKNKKVFYMSVNGKIVLEKYCIATPIINESILHRGMIERLVKKCKKIESHFALPQDIEWALCKKRLYILQSRPITNISM